MLTVVNAQPLPAVVVEPNSPVLYLMFAGLFIACGYLGSRAGRLRAARRGSQSLGAPLGTRIMIVVGLTAIVGVIFLYRGGTPNGRHFFFFVLLPLALLWIVTDIQYERGRRS